MSKKFKAKKKKQSYFLYKLLVLIVVTLITLIFLKSNNNFKNKFYEFVYEKSISFQGINNLYQKYFGSPIPIIEKNVEPVMNDKLTYSDKEKYFDGVKLKVSSNYLVPALESGMVIFIGEKENYGNTVIIECVNGVEMWYSNIQTNLKMYDYIDKSSVIGEANNTFNLVFKKDGEILNYEDYI